MRFTMSRPEIRDRVNLELQIKEVWNLKIKKKITKTVKTEGLSEIFNI